MSPLLTTTDHLTAAACSVCAGTGWADPWDLADGAPQLVSCDRCLGVGLEDCPDCEGDGAVAPPVPCSCQDGTS